MTKKTAIRPKVTRPTCRRCKVKMKVGKVILNGVRGLPDFEGDKTACTLSPDHSKASLVDCWKCPKCGHTLAKQPFIYQIANSL